MNWPLSLDALRERYSRSRPLSEIDKGVARSDIHAMIQEIETLRAERDAARVSEAHLGKQIEKLAEFIMFEIDGEPSRSEGVVDTAMRLLAARPERTEPAPGEDIEVVARLLYAEDAGDNWEEMAEHLEDADPETQQAYRNAAGRILAALDLPRRAPTQWAYDQACKALEKHRQRADKAEAALANVTCACDDLKNANDQLHIARDNTARLLEEARAERSEALVAATQMRAFVAEEIETFRERLGRPLSEATVERVAQSLYEDLCQGDDPILGFPFTRLAYIRAARKALAIAERDSVVPPT